MASGELIRYGYQICPFLTYCLDLELMIHYIQLLQTGGHTVHHLDVWLLAPWASCMNAQGEIYMANRITIVHISRRSLNIAFDLQSVSHALFECAHIRNSNGRPQVGISHIITKIRRPYCLSDIQRQRYPLLFYDGSFVSHICMY